MKPAAAHQQHSFDRAGGDLNRPILDGLVNGGTAPIHYYDCLGSTNDQALLLAEQGVISGTAVVARLQTAGRGRQGRHWQSYGGNLLASVILRDLRGYPHALAIPFIAIAALHRAVATLAAYQQDQAPTDLQIKWPNDLLWAGQKLAGILVETHKLHDALVAVIGVGVNVSAAPILEMTPATSLAACGLPTEPGRLLRLFLDNLQSYHQQFLLSGLDPILEYWRSHAFGMGQLLPIRDGKEKITMRLLDIAEDGSLLVDHPHKGHCRLNAAEVFAMKEAGDPALPDGA